MLLCSTQHWQRTVRFEDTVWTLSGFPCDCDKSVLIEVLGTCNITVVCLEKTELHIWTVAKSDIIVWTYVCLDNEAGLCITCVAPLSVFAVMVTDDNRLCDQCLCVDAVTRIVHICLVSII